MAASRSSALVTSYSSLKKEYVSVSRTDFVIYIDKSIYSIETMMLIRGATALASLVDLAADHGAMLLPRSRNSVDYTVGVNTQRCSNTTGAACNNGQAAFWYSQGRWAGVVLPLLA